MGNFYEHLFGVRGKVALVTGGTRGIGLMHQVELQRNPEANEDFREEDGVRKRMSALLKEQGLLVRSGASIPIAPPLVINREQVDELVDMLDQAIGGLERDLDLA